MRVFSTKKRFVSSANSNGIEHLHALDKSLIYTRNKSGPNIEPWGTPHLISF